MPARAPQSRRTIYRDDVECYRHIVVAIMYRAYQDACGTLESTGGVLRNRAEIMRDGAAYFDDGRFEYHAELIGLDPALRPEWENET